MSHNTPKNERGIALITTLLLMVMGFAVVVILLHLVTQGTKISGIEQRYSTALEASKGGEYVIIDTILNDGTLNDDLIASGNILDDAFNADCLYQKLTKVTSASPKVNWPSCTDYASTTDPTKDPDVILNLSNYQVSIKIVDTKETSEAFIYTINVRAQVPNSPEHSEISFLYQVDK
ncbi:hypothetical protein [Desulforhabdus amnigena]|uniref:Type IV pilus minor pilin PilX n=1 Tax=Desulforhabdus amnigena TaxID=40218 RepID=A0A9W6FVS5_9BACT|nr:hypothetical protein [Desulforhabdus amnigena]NLJ29511.1 hypothetical protein [Deltaproteobacteria bacterium]GLI35732.1 type IV pilus minor pilin PilX [Desulforhabdus amnigena]